jgi:hypothetical protein
MLMDYLILLLLCLEIRSLRDSAFCLEAMICRSLLTEEDSEGYPGESRTVPLIGAPYGYPLRIKRKSKD